MINSIQQFCKEGVENLEKVMVNYSADMTKIAEMVYGVTENVVKLGLSIITEELEYYDDWLRKSAKRKAEWQIVRRDETTLLTSLGSITYHKTLFIHKETGKREYLLDQCMGLEKHARMTEDAEAKMLEEAVESCYRKGGENVSLSKESVSKQTVMNKIHYLRFPVEPAKKEKKQAEYLYIDADEDHVSLQYLKTKGDIGNRRRSNTIMPKIVYVYEGISKEGGRNELKNVRYFGGVYEGSRGVEQLWDEVWEYICGHYDEDVLKKVYINGDGAAWIKTGAERIEKGEFVLDKFHMNKYILGATAHLLDSAEDARRGIYKAIRQKQKRYVGELFDRIEGITESETRREKVEVAKNYILGNWEGIMEGIKADDCQLECSAEGHVSHIYAARMSSRPLGWSRQGVNQMSRLRVYYYNKGNMLELVRYQKQEAIKAAGGEERIYSSKTMFVEENRRREELGMWADMPVYRIPYPQVKKIANLKNHIWGL